MLLRGFLLDSARGLERQSYYRRVIDFAAERGMNAILWHFTDDQGCSLNFESVPGIGSPNAFSKAEMVRLIQYAADHGIDLIPELATLGHSRYITRLPAYRDLNENKALFSGICPVAQRTRKVLKSLIEETAEIFPSQRLHVGLDEVNFGGHHLTREALLSRTRGEIFADHVNFVRDVVKGCGRQMWMWADGVLHEPQVARLIPRDVVMCDWQYRPQVPPDSMQYLLNEGFDVLLFSALISHDQTLFPGNDFALPNLRVMRRYETLQGKGRILGNMTTVWTPVRYIADSLWLGLHLAAAVMRDGAEVDFQTCISDFAAGFYGIDDSAGWTAICERLLRLIPRREEWLAVAKLETQNPPQNSLDASDLSHKAEQWNQITSQIRQYTRQVRNNRREYRAFQLMTDVVAHSYDVAHQISAPKLLSRDAIEKLKKRGQRLLQRVEAVWDHERHPNDPAKYAPIVEFFRDDHLILILRSRLTKLDSFLAPARIARKKKPIRNATAISTVAAAS